MTVRRAVAMALCTAGVSRADIFVPVTPSATFLRTNQDQALPSQAWTLLDELGVRPGDLVRFRRVGGYGSGGGADNANTVLIACFSTSFELRVGSQLNRVIGAVEPGPPDAATPPTLNGSFPTDVPQDFLIAVTGGVNEVTIRVPPGAEFIFFSPLDNFFQDNTDPNHDFGVEVAKACPPDFNDDGFVDFFDFDAFTECFAGGPCPPGKTADYNHDGFTDFFDYDAFVAAFEAGC